MFIVGHALTGGSENVNFLKYSPLFMLLSVRI